MKRSSTPQRRDGGYALVFVLVVIVVLCLVASSMLSVSLRNLQNQQTSIERMQDEYAAQGAIEQVVSQLCATESFTKEEPSIDSLEKAIQKKINDLCHDVYGEEEPPGTVSPFITIENGQTIYPFELTSTYGSCTIVCKLELKGTFTGDASSGWTATNLSVTYLSYEVGQTAAG